MSEPVHIGDATLYTGDVLAVLAGLPEESVHCVVTSPPYWGLRDYGIPPTVWDGDPGCAHEWGEQLVKQKGGVGQNKGLTNPVDSEVRQARDVEAQVLHQGAFCQLCGAWLGAHGLEPTPELYVKHEVQIFRAVRRVLRKDGTLWLNLGDSYAGSGRGPTGANGIQNAEARQGFTGGDPHGKRANKTDAPEGFKAKDLIGIPWRVAIALSRPHLKCKDCGKVAHYDQWGRWPNGRMICPACEKSKGYEIAEAGWYLRSDIIWAKPNPMPESVTDRPTKAHEYLFLLSKSPRYFYDAEAIKEPVTGGTHARISQNLAEQVGSFRANGGGKTNGPMKAVVAGSTRKMAKAGSGIKHNDSYETAMALQVSSRNKRSVWTIATESYSEAHFATFPRKLVQPCILAGCPEHACPSCGAPWVREVDGVKYEPTIVAESERRVDASRGDRTRKIDGKSEAFKTAQASRHTIGEHPTCSCGLPAIGGTVLDPFGGSGTVGEVALEYGRRAILIELKPEYVELQKRRLAPVAGRPMLDFTAPVEPDEVREFRESLQKEKHAVEDAGGTWS